MSINDSESVRSLCELFEALFFGKKVEGAATVPVLSVSTMNYAPGHRSINRVILTPFRKVNREGRAYEKLIQILLKADKKKPLIH